MKAINLIPQSERRGGGAGAAGRSGGAVYVFLGLLAAAVVLVSALAVTNKSIDDKRAELADVTARAEAAESQTQQLSAYTKFAALRAKRVQTVKSLVNSRFDWAHSLHEVSRVLPDNAWLLSVTGTVAPGAGGVSTSSLRSAIAVPALDITGCTTSQASVAKVLAAMKRIDGAQRVSLQSSQKLAKQTGSGGATSDSAGSGGGGGGSESDCRNGNTRFPQFQIVVFLNPGSTGAPSTTATAAATGAGSAPTAAAATTTPAATTPAATTPASTTPAATTPDASTPAATTPSTGATK